MRITGVRTQLFEVDLWRPLGDANLPGGTTRAAHVAVQVDTDEGLTGVAIGGAGAAPVVRQLGEHIVGRDPRGVRGIWQHLMNVTFKGGNEGVAIAAIATLDVALWDLKAKANDEPLWRTLGGDSPQVTAYASGLDLPLDDTALGAYYERMAKLGMRAGKLKVGRDHADDLRRVGIMRDALSASDPRPVLAVDYNEYTTPTQAIRRMAEIEERFDIAWCEEPARRWDYRGLRRVSQSIRAAVATGENLAHVGQYMPLVANEAVDLVQIGHGTGGISGALQVAELAHAFELPVAMMSWPGDAVAHLAAVLPHHTMMEIIDAGMDTVLTKAHDVRDGMIFLSEDVPGTGLAIAEEQLDKHAVERVSAQAAGFPWGRAPTAGADLRL